MYFGTFHVFTFSLVDVVGWSAKSRNKSREHVKATTGYCAFGVHLLALCPITISTKLVPKISNVTYLLCIV